MITLYRHIYTSTVITTDARTYSIEDEIGNRIDFEDASTWPWPFPKSELKKIVKHGAKQVSDIKFPNKNGRLNYQLLYAKNEKW